MAFPHSSEPRWLTSVWTWAGLAAFATAVQIPFPISFGSQWLLAAPFVVPFLAGYFGGWRGILGVAIGTVAANGIAGSDPVTLAGAAATVVLEAGLSAYFVRAGRPFDPAFCHPHDVIRFAAVAVSVAAVRSFAGYSGTSVLSGNGITTALSAGCHAWFATILAAPAFLLLSCGWPWRCPRIARVLEGAIAVVMLLGVNDRIFGQRGVTPDVIPLPTFSVLVVVTTWVVLRFETKGMAALAFLSLVQMVALGLVRGTGLPLFSPESAESTRASVLILGGIVALLNLFVAAVMAARRRQDEEQRLLVAALREKAQKLSELNELLAEQTGRAEAQATRMMAQNGEIEEANHKLARQQAWVDAVLASIPVGVSLIDRRAAVAGEGHIRGLTTSAAALIDGATDIRELERTLEVTRTDGTPIPAADWPLIRAARSGERVAGEYLRVRRADGAVVTLSVNAAPIRDPDGTVAGAVSVSVDVTERERIAEMARETDERLRFALTAARTIAWEREATGGMIRRTGSVADWLGYPVDVGFDNLLTYAAHVHPDDRADAEQYFYGTTKRVGEFAFEYRMVRADGGIVWVATRGNVIPDETGRPSRIAGVHIDVTEQKVTEQKLRLLESAVVHARDAVVLFDATVTPNAGRSVLYVNDAFCAMSGYTRHEVVGRSLSVLRGPDSSAATLDELRGAPSTRGSRYGRKSSITARTARPTGRTSRSNSSATPSGR